MVYVKNLYLLPASVDNPEVLLCLGIGHSGIRVFCVCGQRSFEESFYKILSESKLACMKEFLGPIVVEVYCGLKLSRRLGSFIWTCLYRLFLWVFFFNGFHFLHLLKNGPVQGISFCNVMDIFEIYLLFLIAKW